MKKRVIFIFVFVFGILIASAGDVFQAESFRNTIATFEREWNINKTGLEENLDVTIENINSTAARVTILYSDTYKTEIEKEAKDAKSVPVSKEGVSSLSATLKVPENIDLSKETSFIVNFDSSEDVSFKIGWNSIIIDAGATNDATANTGDENGCVDIYNRLHVTYVDTGSDLMYSNNSDYYGAANWALKELDGDIWKDVGIICMPNGSLLVYGIDDGNVHGYWSHDNGSSFGNQFIMADEGSVINDVSCAVDGNNNIECVYVESNDELWRFNSSNWNTEYQLTLSSGIDDSDVEIDDEGYPWIVGANTADDVYIYTSRFNSWSPIKVYEGLQLTNDGGLSISIRDNKILIASQDFGANGELIFINSTVTNYPTFNNMTIDWTASSGNGDAIYNGDTGGSIFIIYSNTGGNVYYANRTIYDNHWDNRTLIGQGYFPSVFDSNYPVQNRFNDTIRIVTANTSDLIYYNFTIKYPEEAPPDLSPTISNFRNTSTDNQSSYIEWTCSENCNYTIKLFNNSARTNEYIHDIIYNNTFATTHNPYWGNFTNSTYYYINLTIWDSTGNSATNNTFNFTTAESLPTSCTYGGSGNWDIDLSDNCVISSLVTGDGSTFSTYGSGTLTLNADITGFVEYSLVGTNSDSDRVICLVGCFT